MVGHYSTVVALSMPMYCINLLSKIQQILIVVMPEKTKKQPGPSSVHIDRIHQLRAHLQDLPESLPEYPLSSRYHFALNVEFTKEEGYFAALSKCLEVAFINYSERDPDGTRIIKFVEQGTRLTVDLISFLKTVYKSLSDAERNTVDEAWVERLI